MHTPLTKKNVTLIRQIITPHERVSTILRFLAISQSYEDLKYSTIMSPQVLCNLFPKPVAVCIKL